MTMVMCFTTEKSLHSINQGLSDDQQRLLLSGILVKDKKNLTNQDRLLRNTWSFATLARMTTNIR